MFSRLLTFFSSFLILFAGLLIYVNLRPPNLVLHQLLAEIGILDNLKFEAINQLDQLPDWMLGSLPDGLWMMALTLFILGIWDFKSNAKSRKWLFIVLLFGLSYEFGQYLNLFAGQFDLVDIVFIFVFWWIPISLIFLLKHFA